VWGPPPSSNLERRSKISGTIWSRIRMCASLIRTRRSVLSCALSKHCARAGGAPRLQFASESENPRHRSNAQRILRTRGVGGPHVEFTQPKQNLRHHSAAHSNVREFASTRTLAGLFLTKYSRIKRAFSGAGLIICTAPSQTLVGGTPNCEALSCELFHAQSKRCGGSGAPPKSNINRRREMSGTDSFRVRTCAL
jgi:hypothetical protein